MRQINFVILFVALVGIALFAMQNASPTTVSLAPGLQFQSPLVLELLIALGLGAGLAWIYSLWARMQFVVEARQKNRELQEKEVYITKLKEMVVELESTVKQLPPSKRAEPEEGEAPETVSAEAI